MHAYLGFAITQPHLYQAMFTRAEVAWACLHGLAALQIGGRRPESRAKERLAHALQILAGE